MKEKSKNRKPGLKPDVPSTMLFCCLFAFFLQIYFPFGMNAGHAAEVTLSWNKNSKSNVAGYKVSYETSSSSYTTTIDAGNITSCTLSDLQEGTTYYFAARAYNTAGLLSDFSSELRYSVPTAALYGAAAAVTCTIKTSCNTGGSISPSGTVFVASGSSKTFAITPAGGYRIVRVRVDGIHIGSPTAYTFSNVNADHSIQAEFRSK